MKTLAKVYKKQFGGVKFPFEIYDAKGNKTYYENSNGYWRRYEYDAKGNTTYRENSNGDWARSEYDGEGNKTYWEDSDGVKWGTPKNSCINKMIEIDGKKYKLKEVK